IDQIQESATSRIFDSCPIPNHRMNAGTRVRVGTESPTATIGSKNQWTTLDRAIPMPSATPQSTAMAKPEDARKTVTAASWRSSPSASARRNAAPITESGGRKKNGTRPLRATASHATATRTSEYDEATTLRINEAPPPRASEGARAPGAPRSDRRQR